MKPPVGLNFVHLEALQNAYAQLAQLALGEIIEDAQLVIRVAEPLKPFSAYSESINFAVRALERIPESAEEWRKYGLPRVSEEEAFISMKQVFDTVIRCIKEKKEKLVEGWGSKQSVGPRVLSSQNELDYEMVEREQFLSNSVGKPIRVLTSWGDFGLWIPAGLTAGSIVSRFILVDPPYTESELSQDAPKKHKRREIRVESDDEKTDDYHRILPFEHLMAGGKFAYTWNGDAHTHRGEVTVRDRHGRPGDHDFKTDVLSAFQYILGEEVEIQLVV